MADDARPVMQKATSDDVQPSGESQSDAGPAIRARGNWRRRITRFFLLVLVPICVIAAGLWVYATGGRYVTTENAYVKARKIAISADLDGRVTGVEVDVNERVKAGQLLVSLDRRELEIAFAEQEAVLQRTRASILKLKATYRSAVAELQEARASVTHLEKLHKRYKNLSARGFASSEKYENAQADLLAARRQVETRNANVAETLVALGGRPDGKVEQHPIYMAEAAKLEQVLLNLENTEIRAPADGVVSAISLEPGEYVEEGKPMFALVEDQAPWVIANLKETQLTHVRVGQTATIVADAYPDHRWEAVVTSIAPATGAEFAILPPQNATGNWIKIVQRVPVRIHINPDELAKNPLRIGLSTVVDVNLHDQSGPVLAQQPPKQASFTTDVYTRQLADADTLIARLIHENSASPTGKSVQR